MHIIVLRLPNEFVIEAAAAAVARARAAHNSTFPFGRSLTCTLIIGRTVGTGKIAISIGQQR